MNSKEQQEKDAAFVGFTLIALIYVVACIIQSLSTY